MPDQWQPGVQYEYGAIVEYHGAEYSIIQPHRSQGDWTPDQTPALWGRRSGGGGHHQGGGHHGHHEERRDYDDNKRQDDYSQGRAQQDQQQQQQQQQQPSWLDQNKEKLEIAGGVAAGLGAIGAAYGAYSHHQHSEENKRAEGWARENWVNEARGRTEAFHRTGPTGPYTWILVKGKDIPREAIEGGNEKGNPLYIARAYYEGGVHLGKAGRHLGKGAVIGYDNKEIEVDEFEVLIGDPNAVRWVAPHGSFTASTLGGEPVEGGKERDGTVQFIVQAPLHGTTQVGKTSDHLKAAYVPYGGHEQRVDQFQLLIVGSSRY